MPGITFTHTAFDFLHKFVVFQAPVGSYKKFLGRLRCKAFKHNIGAQTLHIIHHSLHIIVESKKMEIGGRLSILFGHTCTAYQLQLVHFECCERQARKFHRLTHNLSPILTGEPENNMCAHGNTTLRSTLHCIDRGSIVVPSVYAQQGCIVTALNAILHKHEGALRKFLQVIEQFIGHTIGACAYHKPNTALDRECLFVTLAQHIERCVSICVGLEIGKVTHLRVLVCKEGDTLPHLLGNRLVAVAICRVECLVVTICATATPLSAVTVRAREATIESYLLHLEREMPLQKGGKVVIVKAFFCIHKNSLSCQTTNRPIPQCHQQKPCYKACTHIGDETRQVTALQHLYRLVSKGRKCGKATQYTGGEQQIYITAVCGILCKKSIYHTKQETS